MNTSTLPQELMSCSLIHFENAVPIDDLNLREDQKRRLARVQHVYWQWVKNPWLDTYALFRQMVKGLFADAPSETRAAQKDELLFKFVRDHVSPPSRAVATAKVRAVADRLMLNGMQTDNGKDMAAGAKIAMRIDRLDQPDSEQADFSKAVFLPPVVTTSVKEIDPSKEDQSDEQARLIMSKYNAFIDDKRKAVDSRVDLMMARRDTPDATEEAEYTEE